MDTSTLRLIIFLGMFLIFAGDHNALYASIFGNAEKKTDANRGPEAQLKEPHGKTSVATKTDINEKHNVLQLRRAKMMATIKTACLPKLICELTSSVHQDQLNEMERSLLNIIRDTSLSTLAEVPSRYHFAAHMGQLISGIEGQGCHNFYPTCPLPGISVLNMMKKIRLH